MKPSRILFLDYFAFSFIHQHSGSAVWIVTKMRDGGSHEKSHNKCVGTLWRYVQEGSHVLVKAV